MPDPLSLVDHEIDASGARRVHALAARHAVTIWSVSWGTRDHGERFVARPAVVVGGKTYVMACHLAADTLDALRAKLPPGLSRTDPAPGDDATIVEVWL